MFQTFKNAWSEMIGTFRNAWKVDEMRKKLIRELSHKFTQDDDYIESEIKRLLDITLCFELDIEHMTGKLVNEA